MKSTEPHPSRRLSAEFSNFQTLYKTRGSTQWVWTIIGALLVAIGACIEVQPRLTYLPPDGLVTAITMRSGWPFGRVKFCFDWTLVILAMFTSLILMGRLYGVREGTVFAASSVGFMVKVIGNAHGEVRNRRHVRITEQQPPEVPGNSGAADAADSTDIVEDHEDPGGRGPAA